MCKTMTANALRLKEYIDSIDDFCFINPEPCPYMNHIGALFTDSVLQAGLNYRKVVWPRVNYVLQTFPYADTVQSFSDVLNQFGTANVLRWNNKEKLRRMEDLVSFCLEHDIDSTRQLTEYMKIDMNIDCLKSIHGIGDKTCDYMKRLLGFDTVAVDRHVRAFVESADILCQDYFDFKEVVEFAADFMDCARRELDYSIWNYMSQKESRTLQLEFDL